jgi:hypothetical protein
MECPQCHAENLPDAGFCEDCAMVLEPRCPHCQANYRGTSRFCRKCGLPLISVTAAAPAPESKSSQGAMVLYPRCGSANIRKRMVVACRRLYDASGQVHKEVRTFGAKTPDLLKLSDWLGAQGVTHIVVAGNSRDWPRACRLLEHSFTVLRTTEVNDAEALAERLALGLIHDTSHLPVRATLWRRYRAGLMAIAALCAVMLILPDLWWYSDRPVPTPLSAVAQWLPQASVTKEEPVEVTLAGQADRPSWLDFDGSSVHISGVAPLTAGDKPYHLILRTRAGNGDEKHLHLYITRTELAEPHVPPTSTTLSPIPTVLPGHTRYSPSVSKFGW